MEPKLQITVRNIARNDQLPEIVDWIGERFERLLARKPDISHCEVTVSLPHRSHSTSNDYQVRVDVSSGRMQAHAHSHGKGIDGADVHCSIARAFSAAEAQLTHANPWSSRRSRGRPWLLGGHGPLLAEG